MMKIVKGKKDAYFYLGVVGKMEEEGNVWLAPKESTRKSI